jgi:hypothetical protein
VARQDARIALTTNLRGHFQEFYAIFRTVLAERGEPHLLRALAAHEDHRGTRATVCAQVARAGFEVVAVVEDQFTLRYLNGGALLRHPLTRLGFLDGWRAVLAGIDEQPIFAALEQRLDNVAAAHDGLTMTVPMLYVEGRRRPATG